jgi:hypothetical protein
MYKDKKCLYDSCENIFTPTTGSQKYCPTCSVKAKQAKDRLRWRERSRKLNNYKEHTKFCEVCGKKFKTFYSKKLYCGSEKCEKVRTSANSVKSEFKRSAKKRIQTQIRKQEKRVSDLTGIHSYFAEYGYEVLDDSEYINSHTGKIRVKCVNGHEWNTTFHNFKDNNNRCITCYLNNNYTSKLEQKMRDFFEKYYPNIECVYNDRTVIAPKELDLYFPSKNVAVEVCGLYWHSESFGNTDRSYHYEKMIACFNKGIRLLTIFEDEINNKFDMVISRICQALGIIKHKIFARKCYVKEISTSEANVFFDNNHLQGKSNGFKAWGLFSGDNLISACSVGSLLRKHVSNKNVLELKRFCSLKDCVVVGGANKLFKSVVRYAKEAGYEEIRSYCDMRYANIFNVVYDIMGFKLLTATKYTPHYFKAGIRYRNFSLRKTASERESNKTEFELRKAQGYDRIWDCGYRTYIYELSNY